MVGCDDDVVGINFVAEIFLENSLLDILVVMNSLEKLVGTVYRLEGDLQHSMFLMLVDFSFYLHKFFIGVCKLSVCRNAQPVLL